MLSSRELLLSSRAYTRYRCCRFRQRASTSLAFRLTGARSAGDVYFACSWIIPFCSTDGTANAQVYDSQGKMLEDETPASGDESPLEASGWEPPKQEAAESRCVVRDSHNANSNGEQDLAINCAIIFYYVVILRYGKIWYFKQAARFAYGEQYLDHCLDPIAPTYNLVTMQRSAKRAK